MLVIPALWEAETRELQFTSCPGNLVGLCFKLSKNRHHREGLGDSWVGARVLGPQIHIMGSQTPPPLGVGACRGSVRSAGDCCRLPKMALGMDWGTGSVLTSLLGASPPAPRVGA